MGQSQAGRCMWGVHIHIYRVSLFLCIISIDSYSIHVLVYSIKNES